MSNIDLTEFFNDARLKLQIDKDAKPVYFWCDCNIKLIPANVNDFDERDKELWKLAIAKTLRFPVDVFDDTTLQLSHKCITSSETCDLPSGAISGIVKKFLNSFELYYEEENGVQIGLSYYENKLITEDSLCYDVKKNTDGNINITRIYTYAFLIKCNKHCAFIYKAQLKALLCFNPTNPKLCAILQLSPYVFNYAKSNDPEIEDIMLAIKAKHDASLYFDTMNDIIHKCREDNNFIDEI